MIHYLHQILLYLHISLGAVGLVVFWLPTLSKKGTAFHKKIGKIFVWTMQIIAVSGILMSVMVIIDPIAVRAPSESLGMTEAFTLKQQSRETATFLLMLSMLVYVNVKQSVAVLKVKVDRELLKTVNNLLPIGALLIFGIIVGLISITVVNPLFIIFSVISISVSVGSLRYIYKQELKQREWIIEHMGNILGAGIAAYTAFFAFGGRRLFSEIFSGQMQLIPWVLPSVIGVAATIYLSKKYRTQYKVA